MNDLYNKFRFVRKDLFHLYNEKDVRFVFEQILFFLDYHFNVDFSNRELAESVRAAAKSGGIIITEETKLIQQIMDYFCDELGFNPVFKDHYNEIHKIITGIVAAHRSDGSRFIEPLTRKIMDEFNTADYSTTMEEVVPGLSK